MDSLVNETCYLYEKRRMNLSETSSNITNVIFGDSTMPPASQTPEISLAFAWVEKLAFLEIL